MNAAIAGVCERVERIGGEAVGIRGGFAGLAERRARPIDRRRSGRPRARGRHLARHEPLEGARDHGRPRRVLPGARRARPRRSGRDRRPRLRAGRARARRRPPRGLRPGDDRPRRRGHRATIGMDSAIGFRARDDRSAARDGPLSARPGLSRRDPRSAHGYLADAVADAAGIDLSSCPSAPSTSTRSPPRSRDRAPTGAAIAVMSEAVGDAVRIGEDLARRAGIRVHPTILGHAQRAARPSAPRPRDGARPPASRSTSSPRAGRASCLAADGTATASPHLTSPTPNPRSARMSLGYDRPLYILAFDHRTSFATKLFGIAGAPTRRRARAHGGGQAASSSRACLPSPTLPTAACSAR